MNKILCFFISVFLIVFSVKVSALSELHKQQSQVLPVTLSAKPTALHELHKQQSQVLPFVFLVKTGKGESSALKQILQIKESEGHKESNPLKEGESHKESKSFQRDPLLSKISSVKKKSSVKKRPSIKKERGLISPINVAFLESFSKNHTALEIHNKALSLLQNQQKDPAVLLLKRNVYRNLFFPSGLLLIRMDTPFDFTPFLQHIIFLLSLGLSAGFLFLAFKKPSPFRLKLSIGALLVSASLILGVVFMLKKKAYSLDPLNLKVAPFIIAPLVDEKQALSELTVIKQMGEWLLVRDKTKQEGWVHKKQVFIVF